MSPSLPYLLILKPLLYLAVPVTSKGLKHRRWPEDGLQELTYVRLDRKSPQSCCAELTEGR